ncbi:hypothetical protein [Roseobacter sp. CCS2]|uniref:hypothetical protein n=1 Tax=Roseobacter sp. CCS2 TaxID=391593 RepID=UPI0000F3E2B7|nr:hypothetical protein [Roseobacter sp. CCS2]EBA12318.1 hypothetical protein RCCS2_13514 [Roseobacter sp. CCS2]
MSLRPDNTLISNREMLLELLATPFRAMGTALHDIATNTARAQTARELAAISDDELKARGMKRADIVSLAFRHDG